MNTSFKAIEKEFRQHIFDVTVIQDSIQDSSDKLSYALGVVDSEIVDLNHILEYCSLSAPEMTKIAVKLKKLFKERREVKELLAYASMVSSKLLIKEDLTVEFESRKTKREHSYQDESRISFNKLFPKEI